MIKKVLLVLLFGVFLALPAARAAENLLDKLLPIPDADEYKGKLAKYNLNGLTVHTYASDEAYKDWTILFENDAQVVMLEPQPMPASARDLRRYVESLGKPLAGIIVSYHGVGPESYPGVPIYATPAANKVFRSAKIEKVMQNFAKSFPDFDVKVILPNRTLTDNKFSLGGIDFIAAPDDNGYPLPGLDLTLPGHRIHYVHMLGGDTHSIIGSRERLDTFNASLEALKQDGIEYFLSSHHMPEQIADLDAKLVYLRTMKEVLSQARTGPEFVSEMKRLAPGLRGEQYLEMTAKSLFK